MLFFELSSKRNFRYDLLTSALNCDSKLICTFMGAEELKTDEKAKLTTAALFFNGALRFLITENAARRIESSHDR